MLGKFCFLPILALSYLWENHSFLSKINDSDSDFLFKSAVFYCALDAFNDRVENAQFDSNLTELNANYEFYDISPF